jgi:hypothetical protein
MTFIRLYFDADSMERAVVSGLIARGLDATTALAEGLQDASDEEHLEHASTLGRVLFSYNARDFHRIHTAYLTRGMPHAGIILAPQQQYSVGERIRRLVALAAAKSDS